MRGNSVRAVLLPALLAAGLGACANNGVQPGYVNTASASGGSSASASTYGTPTGEAGRVVAINDTSIRGGGGSGNGPMVGGLLGGLGGIAIGASGGRGIGGGLIGGLLGATVGAIGGVIFDRQSPGRGIEVVVQKDDGQTVTVAQRDDGDVQLGDRVQIVKDRSGTAKAVRDNSRQPDYQNGSFQNAGPAPQDYRQSGSYGGGSYGPSPQDYRQAGYGGGGYGPPPQDYRQSPQDYGSGPQPADYGQPQRYNRPQSSSHEGYSSYQGGYGPQPQNDPRYGTLQ
jgi:outer membrane lipoprotein SlyB